MVKVSNLGSKLLRLAALAAVCVPLGSLPGEAAPISCVSQGGSQEGPGCIGSYTAGEGGQSNVWKFFTDASFTDLLYTFEIVGTPGSDFSLDVSDFVTSQAALEDGPALSNFPTAVCVPTFDEDHCGLFQVFEIAGSASWTDGYLLIITWFTNANPLSQPPDDGLNTILQAKNGSGGIFGNQLEGIRYDPSPTPTDPGIGGRGDSFSTFGVFRQSVPEPGSLLLFGTALAGVLYRGRRRFIP